MDEPTWLTDYQKIRKDRVLVRNAPLRFFSVTGPDSPDFLHRLTSQDFRNAEQNQILPFAYLSDRGLFRGFGYANKTAQGFEILSHDNSLAEELEKIHFAENLEIELETKPAMILSGPAVNEIAPDYEPMRKSELGWEIPLSDEATILSTAFSPQLIDGISEIDWNIFRIACLEAGEFFFPKELSPETMILEAHRKDAIAENKGCYPGQEIIEIIFSRKVSPPRKLVFLKTKEEIPDKTPIYRATDGANVGSTLTSFFSPVLGGHLSVSIVRKDIAVAGEHVRVGADLTGQVLLPPKFIS